MIQTVVYLLLNGIAFNLVLPVWYLLIQLGMM